MSLWLALMTLTSAWAGTWAIDSSQPAPDHELYRLCDPGQALEPAERAALLAKLGASRTGRAVLQDFLAQYGSFSKLVIQWDGVSYSQLVPIKIQTPITGRMPAAVGKPQSAVCIHLTQRLPKIEHIADLAHELAHATRLAPEVLHGEVNNVDQFVHARLTARGGEADAFTVECKVKNELLGDWDELCSPYVSAMADGGFDTKRVVKDFYDGRLSASLTGETYPVMLARQFKAMLAKKARIQYRNSPYARQ